MSNDLCVSLKDEYENLRESIKNVNDNIKKLTGRDPTEFRFQNNGNKQRFSGYNNKNISRPGSQFANPRNRGARNQDSGKRRLPNQDYHDSIKRGRYDDPEDSPDDEEDYVKKTVQSSIVAAHSTVVKTRKELIDQQRKDTKVNSRNRRWLGLINSTLNQFQQEESKRQHQVAKKVEIEKSIDEAAEKERLQIKKEKEQLFMTRREKTLEMKRLEQKLELADQFEIWEKTKLRQRKFIQTKTSPPLYYIPAKLDAVTQKLLDESQKKIDAEIEAKREEMESRMRQTEEEQPAFVKAAKTTAIKSESDDEKELNIQEDCMISLEPLTEMPQPKKTHSKLSSVIVSTPQLSADSDSDANEKENATFPSVIGQEKVTGEEFEPIYDE